MYTYTDSHTHIRVTSAITQNSK